MLNLTTSRGLVQPVKRLNRVYGRPYRADAVPSQRRLRPAAAGTGMGLAISRTIVESRDGKLWAEANAGPGATFCFTLPAGGDAAIASLASAMKPEIP